MPVFPMKINFTRKFDAIRYIFALEAEIDGISYQLDLMMVLQPDMSGLTTYISLMDAMSKLRTRILKRCKLVLDEAGHMPSRQKLNLIDTIYDTVDYSA